MFVKERTTMVVAQETDIFTFYLEMNWIFNQQ